MLVFQFSGSGLWNFGAADTIVFDKSRFYKIILWGGGKKLSQLQLNSKFNTASNKFNLVLFDIKIHIFYNR